MEWNDDTITRLRALWDDGLSTAEIGRRLGVSKNAVVGKAHRMMLAARPSPIRRDGGGMSRSLAPRRIIGPTLPSLANAATDAAPPAAGPLEAASAPAAPEPPSRTVRALTSVAGRLSACCWPLGDPGTPSFRFCDGPALPSKPYCGEHAQLAYVKVRDRREEAA